jgi:hypothetical protein
MKHEKTLLIYNKINREILIPRRIQRYRSVPLQRFSRYYQRLYAVLFWVMRARGR